MLGGPIAAMNGMIQALAEKHIDKYPEAELLSLLEGVEKEIHYWRTGDDDPGQQLK